MTKLDIKGLFFINRNYLAYVHKNVDREILISHIPREDRGRANAVIANVNYKDKEHFMAIPITSADVSKRHSQDHYVSFEGVKQGAAVNRTCLISKAMPVNEDIIHPMFDLNEEFKDIQSKIFTEKFQDELLRKVDNYFSKNNDGVKFSTNVDKQLQFLNARAELLNQGYSEEEIYGESFAMNVKKAEVLKKTDLGAERIKSKEMELKL